MEYVQVSPGPLRPSSPPTRKPSTQAPQRTISQYWNTFKSPFPGKIFTVLPHDVGPSSSPITSGYGPQRRQRRPPKTYEQARQECIRDVDRIIRESKRTNQKYRDVHFDIEWDLKSHQRDCLDGLKTRFADMQPKGVKRVTDIFEKPQFYINGPTAGDVRQGRDGDCYLMAALCGLGSMDGLIKRVAVKYDQQVGVYGFVFHRDGEWQQTIVDDKLYLRAPDYEEALQERQVWEQIDRRNSEEEYRKAHQTGSRALYFAQCSDENETWLPLLEKAYAKAHGDYAVIDGGFVGEAVEDLTGGVSTEVYSADILDKEKFWTDELMNVGKEFLFGCATGFYSDWLVEIGQAQNPHNQHPDVRMADRRGVVESHAYSIMEAREIKGKRLLKVRNPWGRKEWTGDWSDGSEQWDAEWMNLLGHKFGNDGVFWILYDDLLSRYQHFDRTRIFGDDWTVKQCWTSVDVGWEPSYQRTKFELTLKEKASVVIVLSQLDSRYWQGLEGEYDFELQFRLADADRSSDSGDYIVRSHGRYATRRSVSTDLELPAGRYCIWMKIKAEYNDNQPVEDVLPKFVKERREKVVQIGMSYDLAHDKGLYTQTKEERKDRAKKQRELRERERAEARELLKKQLRKQALKVWEKNKKIHARDKQRQKKHAQIESARAERQLKAALKQQAMMTRPPESTHRATGPAANKNNSDQGAAREAEKSLGCGDLHPPNKTTSNEVVDQHEHALNRIGPVGGSTDRSCSSGVQISNRQNGESVSTPADGDSTCLANAVTDQQLDRSKQPGHGTEAQANGEIIDAGSPSHSQSQQPSQASQTREDQTLAIRLAVSIQDSTEAISDQDAGSSTVHILPCTKPIDLATVKDVLHVAEGEDEAASIDSFPSFEWDSELEVPSSDTDSSSSSSSSSSTPDPHGVNADSDSDSDSDSSSEDRIAMYRPPSPIKPFKPRRSKQRWRRRTGGDNDHPDANASGRDQAGSGGGIHSDDAAAVTHKGEQLWNAVCTVGLRVYSTLADEQVGLRVVWPELESDTAIEDEQGGDGKRKRRSRGKDKRTGQGTAAEAAAKAMDPDDINRGAVVTNPL